MERMHVNGVGAASRIHAAQAATGAHLAALHRLYRRDDERAHRHRARREIHCIGGREVQVEGQMRNALAPDPEVVAVVQLHRHLNGAQRVALGVDGRDLHAMRGGAGPCDSAVIDHDVSVGEVHAQRGRNIVAHRNLTGAQNLGKIHELREVDARGGRQGLHDRPVGGLQRERGDVNRVAQEVAGSIGDGQQRRAAVAAGTGLDGAGRGRAATAGGDHRDREAEQCQAQPGEQSCGFRFGRVRV